MSGGSTGELVWLNGAFIARDAARVSAFDAGFQHAVGLFETMLACETRGGENSDARDAGEPRVFRLAEHLARLERSARELGLTESLRTRALAEAVEDVVSRSGVVADGRRGRVRLTLTGGDLNLLTARGAETPRADPTILIAVTPAAAYPAEMFERGVSVTIADPRANPLNAFESHKTLNYWWRLRALQHAAARGAAEAIVLQVTNHVAGGCVSNLFAVKDGTLITPIARGEEEKGGIPSPVLPGITRTAIMELGHARSIGCDRRMMSIDDLLDADEVFLTNSSWGVLPVVRIESGGIGAGTPGPVTLALRAAWLDAVLDEV